MATQATLSSAFVRAAIKFNAAESDYLVLESNGIHTFEALAYRVPKADDLEDLLKASIMPFSGYKHLDGKVEIFNREPPTTWPEFKVSEDAGALRKLWSLAKEVCKAELEQLASGDADSSRQKVGVANSLAMEADAIAKGMAQPSTDADRPSLFTLTKVTKALVPPGATYEHLVWENYISMEEEGRLGRLNQMPKNRPELVVSSDKKLSLSESLGESLPPVAKVLGADMMRRTLEIRAKAFAMVGAATYQTYRDLHDRYLTKLESSVPAGMRAPTVNEIRRFDRSVHEEVLKWISRNMGTLEDAIKYHLAHEELAAWRLIDPVVSTLPDQGIEAGSHGAKRKLGENVEKQEDSPNKEKPNPNAKKKKCLVCGKKHTPFCQLPPGWRKQKREEDRQKKASAKADPSKGEAPKGK